MFQKSKLVIKKIYDNIYILKCFSQKNLNYKIKIYCLNTLLSTQNIPTRREVRNLSEIQVGEGESIESALKRFKKKIQKAGILSEIKRRERYEKPSVKRKRKAEAARKRRS